MCIDFFLAHFHFIGRGPQMSLCAEAAKTFVKVHCQDWRLDSDWILFFIYKKVHLTRLFNIKKNTENSPPTI